MNCMSDRKSILDKESFSFWFPWVLANVKGCTLGVLISLSVLIIIPNEFIASIFLGVSLGYNQWLILREHLPSSRGWILQTTLGVLAGFTLLNIIHAKTVGAFAFIPISVISFMLFGAILGFAQWIVLRRYFDKSSWWIMANTVAWSSSSLIILLLDVQLPEFIILVLDYLIVGVILGARTGMMLNTLIKNSGSVNSSQSIVHKDPIKIKIVSIFLVCLMLCINFLVNKAPHEYYALPSKAATTVCKDLPPMECIGDDSYCKEVVSFQPKHGRGYIDYPVVDETWDNQYRSYLRRDLMMLVQNITDRVSCESSRWGFGLSEPLMMSDMSEKEGYIPGMSQGVGGHPRGSHQDGNDIDIAYYQRNNLYAWLALESKFDDRKGHLIRSVCQHTLFGMEVYRCTQTPVLVDLRRTALLLIYLSEHPNLRVVGVDGRVGIALERIFDDMIEAGWLTKQEREKIPLAYEMKDRGAAWFKHHHNHIHISMQP